MIETAILGLLTEGDSHGYGIHRRLVEMGFWRISFGSVYPALRRLEAAEAIKVTDTDNNGRKLHHLTSAGRDLLLTKLKDPETVDNSSGFRVRLTFMDLLEKEDRLDLLTRRRDILEDRIEAAREGCEAEGRSRYAQAEMKHRVESMKRDVEWIETLIEKEDHHD